MLNIPQYNFIIVNFSSNNDKQELFKAIKETHVFTYEPLPVLISIKAIYLRGYLLICKC